MSDEDYNSRPLPKKPWSNLNQQKSDDNSVCYGNDFDGWEDKEDRLKSKFAARMS
jgi:hypothetical protein